jgi:hypothetical protein
MQIKREERGQVKRLDEMQTGDYIHKKRADICLDFREEAFQPGRVASVDSRSF